MQCRTKLPIPFVSASSYNAPSTAPGCVGERATRIACKAASQDMAQLDRRALLLALVAAPGLAQLQPAYAGKTNLQWERNLQQMLRQAIQSLSAN